MKVASFILAIVFVLVLVPGSPAGVKVIFPSGAEPGDGTLVAKRGSYSVYELDEGKLSSLEEGTPRPDFDEIQLNRVVIDTKQGLPAIPPAQAAAREGDKLMLVQFCAPPVDSDLAILTDAGARIVQYVPQNAYILWVPSVAAGKMKKAAAAGSIQFYGEYHPYYALSPRLDSSFGVKALTVQFYNYGKGALAAAQQVANSGDVLLPPTEVLGGRYINVRIRGTADQAPEFAALAGVVTVEPFVEPRPTGERQDMVISGNLNGPETGPGSPGYLTWLSGLSFPTDPDDYPIIDVVDDGFDTGDAVNPGNSEYRQLNNPALPSRCEYAVIAAGASGFGPEGRDGHGTINCSIVGGYNDGSGSPDNVDSEGYHWGLGVSPYGRIASTRIFNDSGSWSYPDEDLMVSNQYAAGVRVSSNSWGASVSGAYDTDSQAYDSRTRDAQSGTPGNQEFFFVFAAGNDYSSGTIGSPGTGKNVLTVGASENEDTALNYTDGCGVSPSGADDIQDIASFSSRGPCDDGRIKPEIVGPGTHIHGAASYYAGYTGDSVCDKYNPSGQTKYAESSGTSHSTPALAGCVSLFTNYLDRVHGISDPSPALKKAGIINATRFITGQDANDDLPSNNQGYGLADLSVAFDDSVNRYFFDQEEIFTDSGQSWEQADCPITSGAKPIRITLTWTDAPGATSGNAYVNDLDLEVRVNGTLYLGNNFTKGESQTGGSADPRNNYECVFLPAGTTGTLDITVRATTIAGDGVPGNGDATDQDFAIAAYNLTDWQPQDLIYEGFDDFQIGTRPSGWSFIGCDQDSDTYTTPSSYYGRALPSLKLNASGNQVVTTTFSNPRDVSFWLRGVEGNPSSALLVEEFYSGGWSSLADLSITEEGGVVGPYPMNSLSSRVRFTYSRTAGNLAFDDVRIREGTTPSPTPTPTQTPSPTTTATPYGYKTPTPTSTPTPSVTPTATSTPLPPGFLYLLTEDFEGEWPGWTEDPISGDEPWWQAAGSGDPSGIPPAAYEGSYNALFYYDDYVVKSTRLISPSIDFGTHTIDPTLTFWHTQGSWEGDFDTMSVYYKTSAAGSWQLLESYSSAVNSWTKRTISLPATSSDFYISFVPSTNYGWGVCVDFVRISGISNATPTPTPYGYKTPTTTPTVPPTATPPPTGTPTPVTHLMVEEGFDNFQNGVRPSGWEFNGCNLNSDAATASGYFGKNLPSIRLSDNDKSIATREFNLEQGEAVTFWIRGQNVDLTSSILVEEYYGAGWRQIADVDQIQEYGMIRGPYGISASASRLQFRFLAGEGMLYFDDVRITGPITPTPSATPPPTATPTLTPIPTASPTATVPLPPMQAVVGDYDGDGTSDPAVYRPSLGLWLVRDLTRIYFGTSEDEPLPQDYDGNGAWDYAWFRPSSGVWKVRDITRIYFGTTDEVMVPSDYNGDGTADYAWYRPTAGLWKVKNLTRVYFGTSGDCPVPSDYSGDGSADLSWFRPLSGVWKVKDLTRVYFGSSSDTLVPGDYDGDGSDDMAWFRPSAGLWKVRELTRIYFGLSNDIPVPADYNGDGTTDPGWFRPSSILWKVKDLTRFYFGNSQDSPETNPYIY